ncbi:MAG: putative Zn-dependent protease [Gammaproteobacteria bacterium]
MKTRVNGRALRRLTLGIGLALVTASVHPQSAIKLPDFGDASSGTLSASDEARLGEAFLREILASRESLRDPEVESYVNRIGFALVEHSDGAQLPFTFVVLNDANINAFAGPTGVIGVNTGLLLAAQTESEFAAVIAHEISHVTQRHLARAFELEDQLSIPTMAGLLAAVVLASQSSEAGSAALSAVVGGRAQTQIDLIRSNEFEADRIGIELLARAGYDPRAMASFFEQLQSSQRYFKLPPEYLSTHPVTTTRIAESRSRAERHGYKQFADSVGFAFTQAKLTVLTEGPAKALAHFDRAIAQGAGSHPAAIRYGRALALAGLERHEQAAGILKRLVGSDVATLGIRDAYARSLHKTGKTKEALKLYREGLDVYLYDRILTQGYARLLIDIRRPGDAARVLDVYLRRQRADGPAYLLLAEAHERADNTAASRAALAEHHYYNGRLSLAVQTLEQAQTADRDDYFLASRIDARLEQLRAEHQLRNRR